MEKTNITHTKNLCFSKHIKILLLILILSIFSFTSYWVYFKYLTPFNIRARYLFKDFYISVLLFSTFLISALGIRKTNIKQKNSFLYIFCFYTLLGLSFIFASRTLILVTITKNGVQRFFASGIYEFWNWIVENIKNIDLSYFNLYFPFLVNLSKTIDFLAISTLCFSIATIVCTLFIYFHNSSEIDKPEIEVEKCDTGYDFTGGSEKRTSRNLSYGLLYKPLP